MNKTCLAIVALTGGLLQGAIAPERLESAADMMTEIMSAPDKGIPQDLLEKAHCIVLVPGVKKGAFIFGGKYGKGFMLCRKEGGVGWSAPAAIRVEGGSFGFQIGVSETDVVMLVMNEPGAKKAALKQIHLGSRCLRRSGSGRPHLLGRNRRPDACRNPDLFPFARACLRVYRCKAPRCGRMTIGTRNSTAKLMTNRDIVMGNTKAPPAAGKLLALLNKYSSRK